MRSAEEFAAVAAQITSPDTARHAPLLAGLIRWLRPEVVVEVGTDTGGMAIHLARALQENRRGRLHCIDDFSLRGAGGLAQFWYHLGLAGVGEVVELTVSSSRQTEAWPDRADFVFVDGDHSWSGCLHDVEQAIRIGAEVIAVHDTVDWWGPRRLVAEERSGPLAGWERIGVEFSGGLTIWKRPPATAPPPARFSEAMYPGGHI